METVFAKGAHAAAYSGFEGADDDGTSLAYWLRDRGVDEVDVVGIATDYCVRATARDAAGPVSPPACWSISPRASPRNEPPRPSRLRAAGVDLTGLNATGYGIRA